MADGQVAAQRAAPGCRCNGVWSWEAWGTREGYGECMRNHSARPGDADMDAVCVGRYAGTGAGSGQIAQPEPAQAQGKPAAAGCCAQATAHGPTHFSPDDALRLNQHLCLHVGLPPRGALLKQRLRAQRGGEACVPHGSPPSRVASSAPAGGRPGKAAGGKWPLSRHRSGIAGRAALVAPPHPQREAGPRLGEFCQHAARADGLVNERVARQVVCGRGSASLLTEMRLAR